MSRMSSSFLSQGELVIGQAVTSYLSHMRSRKERSQGLFSNSTGGLEMSIAKGTSSGSIEEGAIDCIHYLKPFIVRVPHPRTTFHLVVLTRSFAFGSSLLGSGESELIAISIFHGMELTSYLQQSQSCGNAHSCKRRTLSGSALLMHG
ncbi:hypothetical protein VNO78_35124 [Psophocarpus tetragonolobus]|uniref:Uncharacterized protein n=1 Tax=Psophocarpus tetragonolobus TaxID=3891 RepID=A0AAN9RR56_PSOTE